MPQFDPHNRGDVTASIKRLKARRLILEATLRGVRKLLVRRSEQLKALNPDGQRAAVVHFLLARVGRHEDRGRPNRAAWLDKWADRIGSWMRGQPWCGLTVWVALTHVGLPMDKRIVSTVEIRDLAMKGQGGFHAWIPWSEVASGHYKLRPGDVMVYGSASSGPEHTGTYVGAGKDVEGNTSPGNGASQNDGGGLFLRNLSDRSGWILGVAIPAYTH